MEKKYCLCCSYLLSPLSLSSFTGCAQGRSRLAWVSLPGPAAWGDPGQLTTLPYSGAEIALSLESRLYACGGWGVCVKTTEQEE